MRTRITTHALALASAAFTLAASATVPARAQGGSRGDAPFTWSGTVREGSWAKVRNLNGSVRVEQGTGDKLEVRAEKHWRRGNPADVKITVRQLGAAGGDVLICALWNDRSSCDEDGYHSHSDGWWHDDRNDVQVEFTVRLPAGVKVDASTVNGGVEVDGATSTVLAHTVNGSIEARSTGGAVTAHTTNGDVRVSAAKLDGDRTEFSTVNGTLTITLPASVNADVDMHTVNGSLSSDFPLTVEGSFNPRRMRATLGKGGPLLRLSTVNGSIRLRKLS